MLIKLDGHEIIITDHSFENDVFEFTILEISPEAHKKLYEKFLEFQTVTLQMAGIREIVKLTAFFPFDNYKQMAHIVRVIAVDGGNHETQAKTEQQPKVHETSV